MTIYTVLAALSVKELDPDWVSPHPATVSLVPEVGLGNAGSQAAWTFWLKLS